jgi:hypothetical protein
MHRILKIEPPAGLTVSILFMVFALLALPGGLTAQSERITTLRITSDTLKIDTLSLVPGSWKLSAPDGNLISDSLYSIDWVRSLLIRRSGFPVSTDSMRLTYHVYPVNLNRTYRHKEPDFNRISPPIYRLPGGAASRDEAQRLSEGMLQSSGSLSRGVALGNTRDASLTSNLNLQLEGRLNKDYRIEATLTDSNIPVQPEGNTPADPGIRQDFHADIQQPERDPRRRFRPESLRRLLPANEQACSGSPFHHPAGDAGPETRLPNQHRRRRGERQVCPQSAGRQ